jgi:hypothetical protein
MFSKIATAILVFVTGILLLFFIFAMVQLATRPKDPTWLERTAPKPVNWDTVSAEKPHTPWEYHSTEDRMTSAITYTAEQRSVENIRTSGHWEDRTSTTTTTNTEITQKQPLFRNKTTVDRLLNPKKVNASTSTTTTSSTHPEWVGNEGPMKLCLKSRDGKNTSVIIYSSTRELPIDFSTVRIRFDKNEPKRYSFTPTSFNKKATDGIIINSSNAFLTELKNANTMLVQISDDDDDFIFTFHVENLTWDHK